MLTKMAASPTINLLFLLLIRVTGSPRGLSAHSPNVDDDAMTIFLAVRMMNNTEDEVKQCGKELTVAREALGAARAKVDAQIKMVFQSEKRIEALKDHDHTLERRVDDWVHKIEAHRDQIESLELLVKDFTEKVRRDENRIRGSRQRVMERVQIIRKKEIDHKAAIHSTKITQQAMDRLKSWPDIDQWRLKEEEDKLKRELQRHVDSHEEIQTRVADVNRQLEEIEAQIKSWEQNKQILGGILTYLDWSVKSLEEGEKVYKQEEKELGSLDDLIDQRHTEYEKSKKELVESREMYGKSIKNVIGTQEKQIESLDKHSKAQAEEIGRNHETEIKSLNTKSKQQMQRVEEAHADRIDDMKDRLEDTVANLKKQMSVKEKKMKQYHDKELTNQGVANKEMLKAKEKHVEATKQWHDAEMDGLKEKNKRLVDAMHEQQDMHKEAMRGHTHHIDEMRSANTATVDAMHKAQSDVIDASTDMQQKQMKAMRDSHEEQLKALRDQHDEQVETLHDHHKTVSEDTRESNNDRVKEMQSVQSDNIKRLEEQIAIREDDIAERDRKIGELIRLQNDALKEHQAQEAFKDLAADKEVENLRHQMEQQMSGRQVQIRTLMDQQNVEVATRESDIDLMEKMMQHFQDLSNSRDEHVQQIADNHKVAQDNMQSNFNDMHKQHSDSVTALKDTVLQGQNTMATMKDAFSNTRGNLCNCLKREDSLNGAVQGLAGTVTDIKSQVGQLQASLQGTVQQIGGAMGNMHRDLFNKIGDLKSEIKDTSGDVKNLHRDIESDIDDVQEGVEDVADDMSESVDDLHGNIDHAMSKLDDAIMENRKELSKSITETSDDVKHQVTQSTDAGVDSVEEHVHTSVKNLRGDLQKHISETIESHTSDIRKAQKKSAKTINDRTKELVTGSHDILHQHVANSVGDSSAGLTDQLVAHKEEVAAGQDSAVKRLASEMSGQVGQLRKQISKQQETLHGSVDTVHRAVDGVSGEVGVLDEKVQDVRGALGAASQNITGVKVGVGELVNDLESTHDIIKDIDEGVDTLNTRDTADRTGHRVNAVRDGNSWTYGYGKYPYGYNNYPSGVKNGEAFPPEAPYYAPISDAQRFQASLDYLSKSLSQAIHGDVSQQPASAYLRPTSVGSSIASAGSSPLVSQKPAAFHQPQGNAVAQPQAPVVRLDANSVAEVDSKPQVGTKEASSDKAVQDTHAGDALQTPTTKPPGFGSKVQHLVHSIKKARAGNF